MTCPDEFLTRLWAAANALCCYCFRPLSSDLFDVCRRCVPHEDDRAGYVGFALTDAAPIVGRRPGT